MEIQKLNRYKYNGVPIFIFFLYWAILFKDLIIPVCTVSPVLFLYLFILVLERIVINTVNDTTLWDYENSNSS